MLRENLYHTQYLFKPAVMVSMKFLMVLFLELIISISCAVTSPEKSVDPEQFKKEFLMQINRLREKGCSCGDTFMPPAPPVSWNEQLEEAAGRHARDMARNNYFSHQSRNGDQLKDRAFRAGYTPSGYQSYAIGENIAYGQLSIEEVMRSWIKSEYHCKNMMNPAFREVGIAKAKTSWVQVWGGRKRFSLKK